MVNEMNLTKIRSYFFGAVLKRNVDLFPFTFGFEFLRPAMYHTEWQGQRPNKGRRGFKMYHFRTHKRLHKQSEKGQIDPCPISELIFEW